MNVAPINQWKGGFVETEDHQTLGELVPVSILEQTFGTAQIQSYPNVRKINVLIVKGGKYGDKKDS